MYVPSGEPADVGDYLDRYRTRHYATAYSLTYEYAVAIEDADTGLRVETGRWPQPWATTRSPWPARRCGSSPARPTPDGQVFHQAPDAGGALPSTGALAAQAVEEHPPSR